MKKYLLFAIIMGLISCKQKKVDLSGETIVKVSDFVGAFPLLTLPFTAADTNVAKIADTTTIGYKVLTQFIPDSAVSKIMPDKKKTIIKPVGRIEKQKEIYLLATFTHYKKVQLVIFVMDKKDRFLAAKELLSNSNNDDYFHSIFINKEPTFLINREKLNADKQLLFTKVGWIYNTGGQFMVVINDGNEDPKRTGVIINPIDALPAKNKYSGNYVKDKKNFISLRDGRDTKSYNFFIHFEKKGNCTGELKGVMKMITDNKAVYKEGGDPCVIDFTFTGNKITFKEKGSCGNRRGMECFFDDTYRKKKEPRPSKKK